MIRLKIYVKEKDNDSLFSLLSSVRYNQLETLMKYAHYLKDTHSEKLIAIYTSLLNDYAERNLGREHYEFIARVLSCIRKLNGGQAVVKKLGGRVPDKIQTSSGNDGSVGDVLKIVYQNLF